MYPNCSTDLTDIWNQDFSVMTHHFEKKNPFWEIGLCTFNRPTLYNQNHTEDTVAWLLEHKTHNLEVVGSSQHVVPVDKVLYLNCFTWPQSEWEAVGNIRIKLLIGWVLHGLWLHTLRSKVIVILSYNSPAWWATERPIWVDTSSSNWNPYVGA